MKSSVSERQLREKHRNCLSDTDDFIPGRHRGRHRGRVGRASRCELVVYRHADLAFVLRGSYVLGGSVRRKRVFVRREVEGYHEHTPQVILVRLLSINIRPNT